MAFAPWAAALAGFRLVRERPWATLAWAGAIFAGRLAGMTLTTAISGPYMPALVSASNANPPKLEALIAASQNVLPGVLAGLVVVLPVFAMVICAIYRAYLRPQDSRVSYLRWGKQEGVMLALIVTVLMELFGASLVYASAMRSFMGLDRKVSFRVGADERRLFLLLVGYGLIYWVFTAVIGMLFGVAENITEALSPTVANFLAFLAPIAIFCIPTFVIVRLSLAPVIAVDRKRISLKESWVSTKGHFWPLAGSLLLSIGLFLIVAFVALILVMIMTELASIGTHGAIAKPGDLFSPDPTAWPAIVFGEVVTAVCIGLLLPVVLGPLVRAYQAYDAPDPVAPAAPVNA